MERSIVRLLAAALLTAAHAGTVVAAAAAEGFTPSPLLGGAAPSADELEIDRLLGAEAGGAPREGGVEVAAWIEPTSDAADVVITLTPTGRAKLVADPGITVTPVESDDGVAWRTPLPYELVDAEAEYFAEPPTIRLPLGAPEVGPIELDVAYAYCFVDTICLFGEERVTAALQTASGGALGQR